MTIAGLDLDRYLTGNPVPVNISLPGGFESGSLVTMTLTTLEGNPKTITAKLYPKSAGLEIDLAPFVKGLLPYPFVPGSSYPDPVPNFININIVFSENQTDSSNAFLRKTFIRGYKREKRETAFTLPIGQQLSPSKKIPVWQGFPSGRFWIDNDSNIQGSSIVDPQYSKQMRPPVNCEPFYVRFLNSLGGYSFWMFDSWEWQTKTKELGTVQKNTSLGLSEENSVLVETSAKREFYPLLRDLISSPMVQVLDKFGTGWNLVELKGKSISENNYEDIIEVSASFDLMLENKPELTW